jgi:hypothetical protein
MARVAPHHQPQTTALDWSVQAMMAAADRVNMIEAASLDEAFAAIGEAVWWITVVDDNIRARYGSAHSRAARGTAPNPSDTMQGLRSARNRITHEVEIVDFIEAIGARPDRGDGRISAWAWRSVPAPRSRAASAVAGHRSYESALAGKNIVHTFGAATGFLKLALTVARDPSWLSDRQQRARQRHA